MHTVEEDHLQQSDAIDRRIAALLTRVGQHVPAYSALWREAGFDPTLHQFSSVLDIKRLPVITKHDLQRFSLRDRCDRRVRLGRAAMERTGGSTGEPFEIPLDAVSRRRRQWRFLQSLMACGYRPGQRLMLLNTRGSSWLTRAANCFCVDLALGERALADRYATLRPDVVYGPLNTLLMLARGLASAGREIPLPRVVISTAEQMNQADRRALKQAFGKDPADMYGMSECGLLAWRASGQDQYTVAGRQFLLEFVPSVLEPRLERLVVTDLAGGAMPLIRFDTGDLVTRDHSRRNKPIVAISGREVDCLRLPDGRGISPYSVTLALEEVGGMERYRVIQRTDFSLDVELWIGTKRPESVTAAVEKVLAELLGDMPAVRVKQADGPLPEGERKFHPVRSEAGGQA